MQARRRALSTFVHSKIDLNKYYYIKNHPIHYNNNINNNNNNNLLYQSERITIRLRYVPIVVIAWIMRMTPIESVHSIFTKLRPIKAIQWDDKYTKQTKRIPNNSIVLLISSIPVNERVYNIMHIHETD